MCGVVHQHVRCLCTGQVAKPMSTTQPSQSSTSGNTVQLDTISVCLHFTFLRVHLINRKLDNCAVVM